MPRILSEPEEVEYVTEVAHFSRQENHDSVAVVVVSSKRNVKEGSSKNTLYQIF